MQKIIWEVQLLTPPTGIRYCKKCSRKSEFFPSGQFRVNAQKKHLDIWLIYKCSVCGSTWNLTVYTRVHPKAIGETLLNQFYQNDPELAEKVSMNIELLRKNGVALGPLSYSVDGPDLDLDQPSELCILSKYPLPIPPATILREKMRLSRKHLVALLTSGQVKNDSCLDIWRCKLDREFIFRIGTK